MTDPSNPKLRVLIATLRQLCTELENLAIENDAYRQLLLLMCVSPEKLDALRDEVLADPQKRIQARHDYAAMRNALERAGIDAELEELLNSLPPTDKPN